MASEEKEVLLSVRHLKQYFRFGYGAYKYNKAVHDVSFDIYKGEVFGLVGESGCGKTTTGRSIIKLYNITSGNIYFKGTRIAAGTRWNEKEIKFTKLRAKEKLTNLENEYKKHAIDLAISTISDEGEYKAKIQEQKTLFHKDNEEELENKLIDIQNEHAEDFETIEILSKKLKKEYEEKEKAEFDRLDAIKHSPAGTNAEEKAKELKAEYEAKVKEITDELDAVIGKQKEEIKQAKYDHKNCDKEFKIKRVKETKEKYAPLLAKYDGVDVKTLSESEQKAYEDLKKEYKFQLHHAKTDRIMNKMQMIFQDPISSIDPRMTVKEIIAEGLRIRGIRDKEYIDKKVNEMLTLVGLVPEHATRYPHEFSGGQRQRIGIARALIMDPELIIADEPISALDVSIQAQVINLLNELKDSLGLTILFIAHDLSVVKYFCNRIAVMYYGNLVELATSDELFAHPMHPYTRSLLSAIPYPDPNYEKIHKRILYVPSRDHDYSKQGPSLQEVLPGHFVRCNDEECEKYRKEIANEPKASKK